MARQHARQSPSLNATGFWRAFRVQLRVLHALVLREASLRLGPHRFGHLLVLADVMWGTAFLGVINYFLERPPPYGESIVFYMFTGMAPFTLYRVLHIKVSAALEANKALLTYPVIRPVDTMLARMLLESTFQLFSFLLFYLVFIWLSYAPLPAHPVELLMAIGATMLLGFSMGVTGMILRTLWRAWQVVDGMIARVLFFISGIFFQVEFLPPPIRDVLTWNPLVHAIEWVRYCIYPNYFTQILDREYLLAWGIIGTVFGLGMERILRPRILAQQ